MILTQHGINSLLRTSPTPPAPSGDYITIGDKVYHYVQVIDQLITSENLDSDIPGIRLATAAEPITEADLGANGEPLAAYYNYDETTYGPNGLNYGRLYNRAAYVYIANHLSDLVPDGWNIGGTQLANLGNILPGQSAKSTSGWNNDTNGDNSFRLNVVPTGYFTWYQGALKFSQVGSYAHIIHSAGNADTGTMTALTFMESTVGNQRPGTGGCKGGNIRFIKQAPQVNIGGVNYGTTRIGNQLWTTENIAIVYNGLSVRDSSNPLTANSSIAQAAYYNYDSSNQRHGLLYNWPAVNYIANHLEELGIADGWRLPSAEDLTTLMTYASNILAYPGPPLRSTEFSRPGNNVFRFNLLPSGYWNGTSFVEYGDSAGLWSTTSESSTTATCRYTTVVPNNFDFNAISASKYCCYSVRLVKDFV